MNRIAFAVLLVAVPTFADEKSKANTLTPKEIAEGWVLLFDGESTFGWEIEGEAQVKNGQLVLGGEKETIATFKAAFQYVRASAIHTDGENRSELQARAEDTDAGGPAASKAVGNSVAFTISKGHPKLRVPAGKTAQLSRIRCLPIRMVSLFNGKDLSGWKVYDSTRANVADPKVKEVKVRSRYTVTAEGWLNVKDGPGDLQTEGQWADFVVQLECISHGKHLNSGLFFRCIPDLYQQGYEAQIRNEWMGDDRSKPVDFGTGAIYRRMPARKVNSNDGEWFTLTVAAHGRRIATWVNGLQVTDWTDDRKENANARQGFKKSKGALSIQGHDPTTDLSFRNIRIQSLDR